MRIAIENLPSATMVPNEFIDRYMPEANGEYVKVFLYLLRHNGEEITPVRIADALELTEGDVRRALTRWQREGLIAVTQVPGGAAEASAPQAAASVQQAEIPAQGGTAPARQASITAPQAMAPVPQTTAPAPQAMAPVRQAEAPAAPAHPAEVPARQTEVPAQQYPAAETPTRAESAEVPARRPEVPPQAQPAAPASSAREALPPRKPADFMKLRKDEEFTTLLYVLQRYLGIIFSQTNTESVAYLYDTLGMSQDLLIYTAEICAERKQRAEAEGRRSADRDWFRYFEKTALLFHEKGFRTTEEAREDDTRFRAAIHAVMNAFGKDCSYPGQAERALIEKWYNEYGFSAEVIGEACSIVKLSTGNINYSYADKILDSWNQAGIRTVDQAREHEARRRENGGQAARRNSAPRNAAGRTVTRFHNLEERDDDLDAYALQKMKKELEEV